MYNDCTSSRRKESISNHPQTWGTQSEHFFTCAIRQLKIKSISESLKACYNGFTWPIALFALLKLQELSHQLFTFPVVAVAFPFS